MNWPTQFQINAWAGPEIDNHSDVSEAAKSQLIARGVEGEAIKLAPKPIRPEDWSHPEVGWGLVLADDDTVTAVEKSAGKDAPEALQVLLAKRGTAPVLRYRPELMRRGMLRRHYADGSHQDIMISALRFGTAKACIPRYLLIWGSPENIPWSAQFQLQSARYVGRIDLEGQALKNYTEALSDDWTGLDNRIANTTVWATDRGDLDITGLMRRAVAEPLHEKFATDDDESIRNGASFLAATNATHEKLISNLTDWQPSLVATTSHGATGPLHDVPQMRTQLGLLVDDRDQLLDPTELLNRWNPRGAFWFAQACCSAGSNSKTDYQGLVRPGSTVESILQGVANCGAMISPLPRALLGAKEPLRAFVGHVEPTFDWTLKHPDTGQFLSIPLIRAFYDNLYSGKPVGMALESCRLAASSLLSTYQVAVDELRNTHEGASYILAIQLMAKDWKSLVLLGDPTCSLRRLLQPTVGDTPQIR